MTKTALWAELRSRHKAEQSLYEFVKQGWEHGPANAPFVDGFHLKAVCDHLEAVTSRHIRNLLINIPIRCSKSSIVSVFWPVWVWTRNPSEQFFYASYAASLALRDAVHSRRLIQSEWYQTRWGHIFQLLKDQKAKSRYDNSEHGYRLTSSVGASITGEGGSILVCFPSHVLVRTDKGDIPIGEIVNKKIQCKVLSFNHEKDALEWKSIEAYEKNEGKELIEIEFEDGSILECTEDHPVFIENKGYIAAKDIQDGDVALSIV